MSLVGKDLKIFIGFVGYGHVGSNLRSAFRERGISVTYAKSNADNTYEAGHGYDIAFPPCETNRFLRIVKYLCFVCKAFLQHNVFIFMYGGSLLPYNLDLPLLKLFHKKTIMWFLGSDIITWEAYAPAARRAGFKYFATRDKGAGPQALRRKLKMVHRVERYVDHIVVPFASMAQLLQREYSYILIPMDFNNIEYRNIQNKRPVVVHAPTHEIYKGTPHVRKAIDQLRDEGYEFEFRLLEGVSNVVLRETLTCADIAVDQLFGPGAGGFALEGMAAGCAVLGGNFPAFSRCPQELPVVPTDPSNIYENLKILLNNPQLRKELGEKLFVKYINT